MLSSRSQIDFQELCSLCDNTKLTHTCLAFLVVPHIFLVFTPSTQHINHATVLALKERLNFHPLSGESYQASVSKGLKDH